MINIINYYQKLTLFIINKKNHHDKRATLTIELRPNPNTFIYHIKVTSITIIK